METHRVTVDVKVLEAKIESAIDFDTLEGQQAGMAVSLLVSIAEDYATLTAQLATARAALERYGRHDVGCKTFMQPLGYWECDCGYKRVFEQLQQAALPVPVSPAAANAA